ncbi:phage integrase SAM-like domain-containing protein [Parasegetibacter sp. NRK P23]
MKYMESLKKMVNWAVKNGWLEKSSFDAFKLQSKD